MREIKFRAWDEKCKKMFYSDFDKNTHKESNNYRFNFDENGCLIFEIYDFNVVDGVVYEDWIILDNVMQYTGLKDKNGQEIYEGDILRGIEHKSNSTFVNGEYQGTHEWDNDIEIIVDFTPSNVQLVDAYKSKCEVIGNIYENQELLN